MKKITLEQFINTEQVQPLSSKTLSLQAELSEAKLAISATLRLAEAIVPKSRADDFSSKVIALTTSENVISELSEKVGVPLESETEEEFVQRASSTLKSILMSKLGNS